MLRAGAACERRNLLQLLDPQQGGCCPIRFGCPVGVRAHLSVALFKGLQKSRCLQTLSLRRLRTVVCIPMEALTVEAGLTGSAEA
jgi:hypothetical protein